jgi:putative transposase
MPRTARLRAPGLPLHIVHRGHNGTPCFRTGKDFERYFVVLEDALVKNECKLHAFVFMTNHVHLLVTSPTPMGASLVMKQVAQKLAQAVNRREGRCGSLWSDRFFSSVVQEDRYLLACYRYIELNPVRANIVGMPRNYRWSSYRHNAEGHECPILSPHSTYLELGRDESARRRAYESMFAEKLDDSIVDMFRKALRSSRAVGDEDFHRDLSSRLGLRTIARSVGRPKSRVAALAQT